MLWNELRKDAAVRGKKWIGGNHSPAEESTKKQSTIAMVKGDVVPPLRFVAVSGQKFLCETLERRHLDLPVSENPDLPE